MPILAENGMLTNFLPEYLNQAIIFAGDDMGGDMSMILAFLYIVIVPLPFPTTSPRKRMSLVRFVLPVIPAEKWCGII